MKPLRYGETATPEHFPDESDVWDLQRFFKAESEEIKKHLTEEAVANWRQQKDVAAAMGLAEGLVSDVQRKYLSGDTRPDQRIYKDAKDGALERDSPSARAIRTWSVGFWIAVLAEATVMVAQQLLSTDLNLFILVLAFFLAVGGYLQGSGLGGILLRRWKKDTKRLQAGDRSGLDWARIAVGTALILFIAALRGFGASEPTQFALVFLVTLLFGEAVAVFETLRVRDKGMRDTLLGETAQAQRWQADMSHLQELKSNGYRRIYEDAVKKADQMGPHAALSSPKSSNEVR